jgi:hypothetical protein
MGDAASERFECSIVYTASGSFYQPVLVGVLATSSQSASSAVGGSTDIHINSLQIRWTDVRIRRSERPGHGSEIECPCSSKRLGIIKSAQFAWNPPHVGLFNVEPVTMMIHLFGMSSTDIVLVILSFQINNTVIYL